MRRRLAGTMRDVFDVGRASSRRREYGRPLPGGWRLHPQPGQNRRCNVGMVGKEYRLRQRLRGVPHNQRDLNAFLIQSPAVSDHHRVPFAQCLAVVACHDNQRIVEVSLVPQLSHDASDTPIGLQHRVVVVVSHLLPGVRIHLVRLRPGHAVARRFPHRGWFAPRCLMRGHKVEEEKVPRPRRSRRQLSRMGHQLVVDEAIDESIVIRPIQILHAHPVTVSPRQEKPHGKPGSAEPIVKAGSIHREVPRATRRKQRPVGSLSRANS